MPVFLLVAAALLPQAIRLEMLVWVVVRVVVPELLLQADPAAALVDAALLALLWHQRVLEVGVVVQLQV
jgi:hypothetical protein